MGLIDAIPDEAIEAAAKRRIAGADRVKGRVSRLPDGRIGRFGWKAQTATLREFALSAAANEVGLESADFHQGADPRIPPIAPRGLDLSTDECAALVEYVRALPAPIVLEPADPKAGKAIKAGGALFKSIGCAHCHLPKLGEIEGLYSDLLLHDLSPELSDTGFYGIFPSRGGDEAPRGAKSKGGDGRKREAGASNQEWRTPPLWGLRDSAPYLHDGRAGSIEEARGAPRRSRARRRARPVRRSFRARERQQLESVSPLTRRRPGTPTRAVPRRAGDLVRSFRNREA